jgi:integrator complex subunit 11
VEGTIGNKLLKGIKVLDIDRKRYEVKMQVENISFSAHADAKGIINLLRHLNMESVVFVHGDGAKMDTFAAIVE